MFLNYYTLSSTLLIFSILFIHPMDRYESTKFENDTSLLACCMELNKSVEELKSLRKILIHELNDIKKLDFSPNTENYQASLPNGDTLLCFQILNGPQKGYIRCVREICNQNESELSLSDHYFNVLKNLYAQSVKKVNP